MSTYGACRDGRCCRVGCATCSERRRVEMRNKAISIPARVVELVMQHGSMRAAARAIKMDHTYLSRLAKGSKKEPSADVLRKLGLRRIVTYQPVVQIDWALSHGKQQA